MALRKTRSIDENNDTQYNKYQIDDSKVKQRNRK